MDGVRKMKRVFNTRRLAGFLSAGVVGLASQISLADDPLRDSTVRPTSGYEYFLTDSSPSDAPLSNASQTVQPVTVQPSTTQPTAPTSAAANYTYQPASTACSCANQCSCAASNKKKKEELAAAMKGAYKGVFYANNFAYLNSPLYDGPYFPGDPFKGLLDGKLDLGGEVRSRYHHEDDHRGLGLTGNDDQFWLTRLRLFANLRVNDYIRIYGEYLYADSAGEDLLIRPIEENRGELNNIFVDVKLTDNLTVRGGRQELLLGAQRLISPLDWANTRRTFDGVRATYAGDNWTLDGFYTQPVNRSRATGGTLEWDNTNDDQHFYGVYGTKMKALGNANLDAYYLGYDNDLSGFSYHTLGNRLWGNGDLFNYELEGGVQFGKNIDGSDHSAGFMTAGLGRQLSLAGDKWKPTVWAWYDWASGGEDFIPGEDGFHHLFPLAHKYNGFMDLFGRRNLNDVNFQFITPTPLEKVKLLLWYHYFFLDQATTPYSVVMSPYNTTAAAGSKDLGSEIDVLATVAVNPRTSVLLGYSHFVAGDYYSTTPGAVDITDADFFYAQFQMRF